MKQAIFRQGPLIPRPCPQCGSELVRACRPDYQPVPGIVAGASPGWRCSVCGREFTAEQIRESKRAKSTSGKRS